MCNGSIQRNSQWVIEFKERMNYFIANGYNDIDIIQDTIYGIMAKYHFDDILFIQYGTKKGFYE